MVQLVARSEYTPGPGGSGCATSSGIAFGPIEELLARPRYFPVHIDFRRDRLVLVETSRRQLASMPFMDGRVPLATDGCVEIRLTDALATCWAKPTGPDRFIFHVAFCGSTLLASLLDVPGRSFAEREPQVLNNIADATGSNPLVSSALDLTRSLLRRPWRDGERVLCKPSNWANSLIPSLTASPEQIRPLFITSDYRDQLRALIRGGRDRMEYVVRATAHLLKAGQGSPALWDQALHGASSGLEIALRIALVSLHIQIGTFRDAAARGGWTARHFLSLKEIEEDPVGACMIASRALELDLRSADIGRAVEKRGGCYAKDPSRSYSPEARRRQNDQIERDYGRLFDRAHDWALLAGLTTQAGSNSLRVTERPPLPTDRQGMVGG